MDHNLKNGSHILFALRRIFLDVDRVWLCHKPQSHSARILFVPMRFSSFKAQNKFMWMGSDTCPMFFLLNVTRGEGKGKGGRGVEVLGT